MEFSTAICPCFKQLAKSTILSFTKTDPYLKTNANFLRSKSSQKDFSRWNLSDIDEREIHC